MGTKTILFQQHKSLLNDCMYMTNNIPLTNKYTKVIIPVAFAYALHKRKANI